MALPHWTELRSTEFSHSTDPAKLYDFYFDAFSRMTPWINMKPKEGGYELDGLLMEILYVLSSTLGFTYELQLPPTLTFGEEMDNGSWTGLRGMLQRRESDMILGPWATDFRRNDGLDITKSFYITTMATLASSGLPMGGNFFNFLLTFDIEIWYGLLAILVVLIILTTVCDKTSPIQTRTDIFSYYFWAYIAAMFCEGSPTSPVTSKGRFLLATWLMAILVLMNSFSGQFKAVLMVQKSDDIIYTVDDISQRKNLVPYLPLDTFFYDVFAQAESGQYRDVFENALKFKNNFMEPIKFLQPEVYQNIKKGLGIAVFDLIIMKMYLSTICEQLEGHRNLYFIDEKFFPYQYMLAMNKNFPAHTRKAIDKKITQITEGNLFGVWLEKALRNFRRCESDGEGGSEFNALGFNHLLPAFYLLLLTQSFALLALVVEILAFKWLH